MIKKIVIGTVVTLVALLIICLVPLKEVAYTVTVDYQDTETCVVTEPLKYQRIGIAGGQVVGNKWGLHYELKR